MNDQEGLQQCASLLKEAVHRFPSIGCLHRLSAAIQGSLADGLRRRRHTGTMCVCCALRRPLSGESMCPKCQDLYERQETVPEDICDCGHAAAQGSHFLRRTIDGPRSFCSPACCGTDYRELMGPLWSVWARMSNHA